MKIGIMGGTFDPIHNGHLMLGDYACREYFLDEVWFMPNGNPPHKDNASIELSAEERARMVSLAIREYPSFRLEDYEIKRSCVSCSYETMEQLTKLYPKDSFYFIIGADSLFAIETWRSPERLFATCTILAAFRGDKNSRAIMNGKIRRLRRKYDADIRLLDTPVMDVSSHELRRWIREGKDVSALLPKTVEAYIDEHQLYRQ